jgi:hypothetical protein|tara:strand:+ start:107 stop:538 length:432 start_codon:yes stop_codon:yes gene_type:complete
VRVKIETIYYDENIQIENQVGDVIWTAIGHSGHTHAQLDMHLVAPVVIRSGGEFSVSWKDLDANIFHFDEHLTGGHTLATASYEVGPAGWIHEELADIFKRLDAHGKKYPTTILCNADLVEGAKFRGIPIVENKYQKERIKLC